MYESATHGQKPMLASAILRPGAPSWTTLVSFDGFASLIEEQLIGILNTSAIYSLGLGGLSNGSKKKNGARWGTK